MITVKLNASKDGSRIVLDKPVRFEPGVRYVINSDFDIFLTWKNRETHLDETFESGLNFPVPNFTTQEHYGRFNDNLLYWIYNDPMANLTGIPLGLANSIIQETTLDEYWDSPLSELYNSLVGNQVIANRTIAEVFQNLTDDNNIRSFEPVQSGDNSGRIFENSIPYFAVATASGRVDPSSYRLSFEDGEFMVYLETAVADAVVKTDLYHYASSNGSTSVEFVIQPGETRSFFINDLNRSLDDFEIEPKESRDNLVNVNGRFSEYILATYPRLYDFVNTYIQSQNLYETPQSYLTNLIDDTIPERMGDDLRRSKNQQSFSFKSHMIDDNDLLLSTADFAKNKGTKKSIEWLAEAVYGNSVETTNYQEQIMRLSGSKWFERYSIYFTRDSLPFAIDDLQGRKIRGSNSKCEGIIESAKVSFISSLKEIVELVVRMDFGEFNEDDIFSISSKEVSDDSMNLGIVDIEVVNGGFGNKVGDKINLKSSTGSKFEGVISEVGSLGQVESVQINQIGWNFRSFQTPSVVRKGLNDFVPEARFIQVSEKSNDFSFKMEFRNVIYEASIDFLSQTLSVLDRTFSHPSLRFPSQVMGLALLDGVISVVSFDETSIWIIDEIGGIYSTEVPYNFLATSNGLNGVILDTDTNTVRTFDIQRLKESGELSILTEFGVGANSYFSISASARSIFITSDIVDMYEYEGNSQDGDLNPFRILEVLVDADDEVIIDDLTEEALIIFRNFRSNTYIPFVFEDGVFEDDVFEGDEFKLFNISVVSKNGIEFITAESSFNLYSLQITLSNEVVPKIKVKTGRIIKKQGSYINSDGHLSSNQKMIGTTYQPFSVGFETETLSRNMKELLEGDALMPGMIYKGLVPVVAESESVLLIGTAEVLE